MRSQQTKRIAPLFAVLAMCVASAAASADSMDVVRTRDADALAQDFGRQGSHELWEGRNGALADRTAQAGAREWDKAKGAVSNAWARTKSYAAQDAKRSAMQVNEPERYGRAGGFIGLDQFEVPQPGITTFESASPNAEAVKSGATQ
jgi:hypothetical protein